jgi:hypothetical protein
MQIELGPTVSYCNTHNVTNIDDRSMGSLNGFEADFRYLVLDRGLSPVAVTLSAEPEYHSLDETTGQRVVNCGLETRIEADAELIKNRLWLGLNLLYEPKTTRAGFLLPNRAENACERRLELPGRWSRGWRLAALDLTDFSRQRARLLLEFEF